MTNIFPKNTMDDEPKDAAVETEDGKSIQKIVTSPNRMTDKFSFILNNHHNELILLGCFS
jgi:hypothetical protein